MTRVSTTLHTQNIQLEAEWDFKGENTQYATHGLHTYLAAMIPPIPRKLIAEYVPSNGSILDPFCGGGAVVVESVLAGVEAAGRDINELAVLITGAKTTHIPQQEIEDAVKWVVSRAKKYKGHTAKFDEGDWVHYWFKPYMMKPLTALREAVLFLPPNDTGRLMRAIFSSTVRDVMLTYRNEIRLRRMSEDEMRKFNPDILERFQWRANDAIQRINQLPAGARANVERGDIRQMNFRDNEFTTIICSPPYGDERNGVPYVQFSKNMLLWLGYSRESIMDSKKMTLGWDKKDHNIPPSPLLHHLVERIKDNPTAVREAIAFYADYSTALKEMARVISDKVIIVIGQRVLHKTIFDNAAITTELMKAHGIPLVSAHYRTLPTKRLPKMRDFGAAIDKETILVYQK